MEILTVPPRDEYRNTYSPYEGRDFILILLFGYSIEALSLSVRVTILMFSAYISGYGNTLPVSKDEYWYLLSTYYREW